MATALQIICVVFIIAAAVYFIFKNKRTQTGASIPQMVLAVFQILLCGWFFALCISDILDIPVNFSIERLIVNICYAAAFLAITIYTLFLKQKDSSICFKSVVWIYVILIAMQCFVFPYEAGDAFMRVMQALEGTVVFGLLLSVAFKLEDASFSASALLIATVLELITAVTNVALPPVSVAQDPQLIDIPLNYAALFMRPVLMASLTLSYRVWLNRRKITEWISPANCFYKLVQIFIRPFSAGKQLLESRDFATPVLAILLHIMCSGAFFYHLVSKTDSLLQNLITWISNGADSMLPRLAETVINFLHDTVISWIGMIPLVGESLVEPATVFADDGIMVLTDQAQIWVGDFFTDFSNALRFPTLLSFAFSALFAACTILLLILLLWAFLKITKHKWGSFKGAFRLCAVRSTVTIPFALISAFLVYIHPLLGILLFSFAAFWSMGHLYTAIMAGADQTSGNRSAAWFPPILILIYILTAAIMIAVIVLVGFTLYHQLADMALRYKDIITTAISGQ